MIRILRFTRLRKSIRSRLLYGFLLVAILPTIAVSLGSLVFGYLSTHNKSVDRLESIVERKQTDIEAWKDSALGELMNALDQVYVLERVQVILSLANRDVDDIYGYYKESTLIRLERYLDDTKMLQSITVLDLQGQTVLSTVPVQDRILFDLLSVSQEDPLDPAILITNDADLGGYQFLAVYPVFNLDGNMIGKLVGELDPTGLYSLLSSMIQSEMTERVFLVNQANVIFDGSGPLAIAREETQVQPNAESSKGIQKALSHDPHTFSIYRNTNNHWVYGVYRWIPDLEMALLIEQDLSSVLGEVFINQMVNFGIILIGIILAVTVSILTARSIASPLMKLSKTSAQIAAGDLNQTAEINEDDEIGLLANSFNIMTAQLRESITSLENRVEDRTSELKESNQRLIRRAVQMQAVYQLSREITAILNVNDLLDRVVNLLKESFGYYAVVIYLVDEDENQLHWAACSSAGSGSRKVLEIDAMSLNGKAVLENQAVMVNDVENAPAFSADEALPETRAELVIPLRRGSQVIGTLDVHSKIANAFDADDLQLIQALGDQIAIAIQNAQLYNRSQTLAVIEERNRLARELHDSISQLLYSQVWFADASQKYLRSNKSQAAEQYLEQLQDSAHQALREMRLMIYELLPSILETKGLIGAIRHRLEVVEQRSGMEIQTRLDPSIALDEESEKALYFITQEVLNNVVKHSKAASVNIRLEHAKGVLVLEITDNGVGFDPGVEKSGLGLQNIAEYAQDIGGVLHINSSPGKGTKIRVTMTGGSNG